jgi:4-amino-4-deoxy-L-arabinose transferase-like glycosyltransferase
MHYVYRHFDGPLYIVVAKTFYDTKAIGKLPIENADLTPSYFAAHLPLYPVFIKIFSPIGYLQSQILVTIIFTILLALLFYYTVKVFKLSEHPLLLTSVMLFLPRFLVLRSVGAPETLFMFFILLSLLFFEKEKYIWAGIVGALAVATKLPGIILFVAYLAVFTEHFIKTKKINWRGAGILLIPLGLVGVFWVYLVQYHDFFAYFHTNYVVPMPYPFAAFNKSAKWVGTGWLEDVMLYFFIYGFAVINLYKSKQRSFFYFTAIFFVACLFVQHKDISRYIVPIWPLVCIAYEKLFTSKKFLLIVLILLPGIYLYAWNFMTENIMPISNWAAYM